MRKTLIIVVVIAALGLITLYVSQNKESNNNQNTTLAQTENYSTVDTTSSSNISTNQSSSQNYKDGTYTGSTKSNQFGDVKVSVNISGGKISSIDLISMPYFESRSKAISDYAGPKLVSETINKQSSNIDTITGATYTSQSYIQSLQSAIDKSKI